MLHVDPLYSLAGVLVGLLVGLTGVGGGSLMTPLLVLVFGFHPATAVGTDLLWAVEALAPGSGDGLCGAGRCGELDSAPPLAALCMSRTTPPCHSRGLRHLCGN